MLDTITPTYQLPESIRIRADFNLDYVEIITPKALRFLLKLHEKFNQERLLLLKRRERVQTLLDAGQVPEFLPETRDIRENAWEVAPIPADLMDRRVEITGPVDRKMVINALNSGAKVFMADFEDSNTPSWTNLMDGQVNLRDAVRGTISCTNPRNGKAYQLNEQTATLMVRPRGWHLPEKHLLVDGEPMSGALVDFGLYFFHNATSLLAKGSGPYFYLPKLESHLEARLWNSVFVFAQDYLNIPQKTIKATVLIETIMASFEMNEILYELRDHAAGLNCGRWDYIFSFIKRFRNRPGFILPDRSQVTMKAPFMSAYSRLVIKTCHKRGAHAMGGMAAQIPIKSDPEANASAIAKVKNDKLLEAMNGHDGTWVAHPGLVSTAMEVFDEHMPEANQIGNKREDVLVSAADLMAVPEGTITEAGIRMNINVGILYIESWLRGNGAAALYHLMEDAATAEISRTQLWQWIRNEAPMEDGRIVTTALYRALLKEELEKIRTMVGEDAYAEGSFSEAVELFDELVTSEDFTEFLTLPAYDLID
jgi:malate synthase